MFEDIRINPDRLWDSIMTMARIGATEKGGCARLTLTDLDKQGRDLFVGWCTDAGCGIGQDGEYFCNPPGDLFYTSCYDWQPS